MNTYVYVQRGVADDVYQYFTTYRNNVVNVEQDPNKGEEQVHV
jgi:hypothetical protein